MTYENLRPNKKLPIILVVPARSDQEAIRLTLGRGKYHYHYNYHWTIGSNRAKHYNGYLYRLPYKKGTVQKVTQGFNGKFSHQDGSRYAVDFGLKEGTGVYAAREGKVVKIRSDSRRGGPTRSYIKDANYIVIEHNDKTLATYAHLKYGGVRVRVGDYVSRGVLIGYSGSTGFAQGPHLHFIVYKAKDGMRRASIPIQFKSVSGVIKQPIKGQQYKAI